MLQSPLQNSIFTNNIPSVSSAFSNTIINQNFHKGDKDIQEFNKQIKDYSFSMNQLYFPTQVAQINSFLNHTFLYPFNDKLSTFNLLHYENLLKNQKVLIGKKRECNVEVVYKNGTPNADMIKNNFFITNFIEPKTEISTRKNSKESNKSTNKGVKVASSLISPRQFYFQTSNIKKHNGRRKTNKEKEGLPLEIQNKGRMRSDNMNMKIKVKILNFIVNFVNFLLYKLRNTFDHIEKVSDHWQNFKKLNIAFKKRIKPSDLAKMKIKDILHQEQDGRSSLEKRENFNECVLRTVEPIPEMKGILNMTFPEFTREIYAKYDLKTFTLASIGISVKDDFINNEFKLEFFNDFVEKLPENLKIYKRALINVLNYNYLTTKDQGKEKFKQNHQN